MPGASGRDHRAGREHGAADAEDPTPSESVTEAAADERQRRGDDEVGVHRDPEGGGADRQIVGDRPGDDAEGRGGDPDGDHRQHDAPPGRPDGPTHRGGVTGAACASALVRVGRGARVAARRLTEPDW